VTARSMHGRERQSQAPSKPLPGKRRRFRFVHGRFAIASARHGLRLRRARGITAGRISHRRAPAEEAEARRGLKNSQLVWELAARLPAIALLLEVCAMWWSRCSPPSILADGDLTWWVFVGQPVGFAAAIALLLQPEWPAGAAGAGCHRIDPLRRPVSVSLITKVGRAARRLLLEMGPGALRHGAPDVFTASQNARLGI